MYVRESCVKFNIEQSVSQLDCQVKVRGRHQTIYGAVRRDFRAPFALGTKVSSNIQIPWTEIPS
jgi:hypothetical protein